MRTGTSLFVLIVVQWALQGCWLDDKWRPYLGTAPAVMINPSDRRRRSGCVRGAARMGEKLCSVYCCILNPRGKFSSSDSKKTPSPGVSPCHPCAPSLLQDISCLQVCSSVSWNVWWHECLCLCWYWTGVGKTWSSDCSPAPPPMYWVCLHVSQ